MPVNRPRLPSWPNGWQSWKRRRGSKQLAEAARGYGNTTGQIRSSMKDIIGLAVLAWPLTLLIIIGLTFLIVVPLAVRYAARHGRSKWRWGIGAFLLVYLPIFWDWIPTVVVHQYYCAKDSGFWVYKTLDQWKAENPGVMERLHQTLQPIQKMPHGYLQIWDERFAIETHRRFPVPLLSTKVDEELLIDRKTGEVLAKGVNVGSGVGNMMTGGGFKFWLNQKPCLNNGISNLSKEIQNMRGTK